VALTIKRNKSQKTITVSVEMDEADLRDMDTQSAFREARRQLRQAAHIESRAASAKESRKNLRAAEKKIIAFPG